MPSSHTTVPSKVKLQSQVKSFYNAKVTLQSSKVKIQYQGESNCNTKQGHTAVPRRVSIVTHRDLLRSYDMENQSQCEWTTCVRWRNPTLVFSPPESNLLHLSYTAHPPTPTPCYTHTKFLFMAPQTRGESPGRYMVYNDVNLTAKPASKTNYLVP